MSLYTGTVFFHASGVREPKLSMGTYRTLEEAHDFLAVELLGMVGEVRISVIEDFPAGSRPLFQYDGAGKGRQDFAQHVHRT